MIEASRTHPAWFREALRELIPKEAYERHQSSEFEW